MAEVGKEVTLLKPGDMVTVEEMIWCGRCIPCRNGYPNHCTNLEEIGFTIPGAFANYIAVDEKFCWKIDAIAERVGSEEKAYELAALTEPTCVAYNAMIERAGGFRPGHRVSVFGAGPIGLAGIALAKAAGASTIAAFEVSPQRLELAKKVGADFAYDPREVNAGEVMMELSKGEGFDFHVEAAGVPRGNIYYYFRTKEEILLANDELKVVWKLRRVLAALDDQQAIELLGAAAARAPSADRIHFLLARAARALGDEDRDVHHGERGIDGHPVLAQDVHDAPDHLGDLHLAERLAAQAVVSAPDPQHAGQPENGHDQGGESEVAKGRGVQVPPVGRDP
mgnify:CR=1 FL=1